jgi:hypothetical protein
MSIPYGHSHSSKESVLSLTNCLPEEDFEPSQRLELQVSETSGLSQQFEDLQKITPDTSTQPEKPASKKKKTDKV